MADLRSIESVAAVTLWGCQPSESAFRKWNIVPNSHNLDLAKSWNLLESWNFEVFLSHVCFLVPGFDSLQVSNNEMGSAPLNDNGNDRPLSEFPTVRS